MTKLTNMTPAQKYEHQLVLNRERQRKYYEANKEKILSSKKTRREATIRQSETPTPEPAPEEAHLTGVIERFRAALKEQVDKGILKVTSIKSHINGLKDFMRITKCTDLGKCLNNSTNVIKMLDNTESNKGSVYAENSKKKYIESAIKAITLLKLNVTKTAVKKYDDYFNKLKIVSKIESDVKTQTVEVPNFNTYLTKVKEKFGETSKQYLLSKVYFEAPLRDNFGQLKIIALDKEAIDNDINYIKVPKSGKGKVITNKYKTDRKYGVISIELTTGLTNLVKEYMKNHKIKLGENLFGDSKSLSDFTSKMNKVLGYAGGVTLFRNMKVSTELDGAGINDPALRLELSKKMGHSPVTQLSYLRKLIEN